LQSGRGKGIVYVLMSQAQLTIESGARGLTAHSFAMTGTASVVTGRYDEDVRLAFFDLSFLSR
jgi:hypothetical protein